jgi:hypothetical protein
MSTEPSALQTLFWKSDTKSKYPLIPDLISTVTGGVIGMSSIAEPAEGADVCHGILRCPEDQKSVMKVQSRTTPIFYGISQRSAIPHCPKILPGEISTTSWS